MLIIILQMKLFNFFCTFFRWNFVYHDLLSKIKKRRAERNRTHAKFSRGFEVELISEREGKRKERAFPQKEREV